MRILRFISFLMIFGACQIDKVKPQNPDSMPNYDLVFNDNSLDEISISVVPSDWKNLQNNLSQVINSDSVASDKIDKKLLVVPALVRFKDGVWNNVGLKFHTSKNLMDGFKLNESYLPLELDFNYFASKFPETANQKFHGFSNLILDNQSTDFSRIRQILVNDLLEELQITTTKNSLKKVQLKIGNQNQLAFYTLKEKVDVDLVRNRFNEDNFNLYRTTSKLEKFILKDFTRLQNGYLPGFGDVQRLINAANRRNYLRSDGSNLNSGPILVSDDIFTWQKSLEIAFDNQMFTRWLALNTVVGNDLFNVVNKESYYVFSGTKTKTNFFYTFPQNSLGLGFDPTMTIDEILESTNANPLVANIKTDPDFNLDFDTEVSLIRKKQFTTAYLYPIIDRYYNQMRLASVGNSTSNIPQLGDIDELKLWIKLRIETLNKAKLQNEILQ